MSFHALYHQLKPRKFRLLLLDAGESSDILRGSLYEHSLDQPPPYEALSYVWQQGVSWGKDQELDCQITRRPEFETFSARYEDRHLAIVIEGYEFPLTQNLAAALWHFRSTIKPRLLWIDQVCINQQDVPDKNQQVRLMGNIYNSAERVLVWLGEELSGVESVFETIRSFPLPGLIPVGGYSTPQPIQNQRVAFEEKAKLLDSLFYTPLRRICQRPWFRRVWVFQEVCLNTHSVVFCGDLSLPLDIFAQFLFHLFQYIYSSGSGAIDVRLLFDAAAFGRFAGLRDRSGQDDLMSLLTKTEACFASDPRDKVFALTGLLNGQCIELGFEPDYGLSTAQAFTHATSVHLKVCGNLDILERAQPRQELEGCRLPSWVPNFTSNPEQDSKIFLPYKYSRVWPFAASLETKSSISFPQPTCLSVTGYSIDEIVHVLDFIPCYPNFNIQDRATEVYASWRSHIETSKNSVPYPWGGTLEHAFWHTITTDMHNQKLRNSFHECPEITQRRATALPELSEKMRVNIRSVTEGRRLATTRAGALALCPARTAMGDIVSILNGGRMPFVLRSVDKNRTIHGIGETRAFELIGECFMHGVMYGAAAQDAKEDRVLETFILV